MSVIVTDSGFRRDDWSHGFAAAENRPANDSGCGLDVASDADPQTIDLNGVVAIRIDFPSFADGRGFTIASVLRRRGFTGRLRARGHVLADQYAMARRSGFDEVEISDDLAARQPQEQWQARANWQAHDYRARLTG